MNMSHQPPHGPHQPPTPAGWGPPPIQPYHPPPQPSALASEAEKHGPIWRRLVFNLLMIAIGAALVVVGFGIIDSDDFDGGVGIWFVILFFTLPTAAIYGALVEFLARVIPSPVGRRALAVCLAPIGGVMGFVVGLGALLDGDLDTAVAFALPVLAVGALWRVPGNRPPNAWLIALGVVAALGLAGLIVADVLVEDANTGGFYCC